jgi:hypothetical protein
MAEHRFSEPKPSPQTCWRSVVLFGENVASYKFALAESLLELAEQGNDRITLSELAQPFSRYICEHVRSADKQGTFRSSRFLDACRAWRDSQRARLAPVVAVQPSEPTTRFQTRENPPISSRFSGWAIQDSNLGPLPYQKGLRAARSGAFSLQMGAKAGWV